MIWDVVYLVMWGLWLIFVFGRGVVALVCRWGRCS